VKALRQNCERMRSAVHGHVYVKTEEQAKAKSSMAQRACSF
jgi:hypothetical protein